MSPPQIRISKTKELDAVLHLLKGDFTLLSDAEIVKLALSDLYHKQLAEKIQKWEQSLPMMELSDEEQESLTAAIKSFEREKKAGKLKPMTADEVMDEIRKSCK